MGWNLICIVVFRAVCQVLLVFPFYGHKVALHFFGMSWFGGAVWLVSANVWVLKWYMSLLHQVIELVLMQESSELSFSSSTLTSDVSDERYSICLELWMSAMSRASPLLPSSPSLHFHWPTVDIWLEVEIKFYCFKALRFFFVIAALPSLSWLIQLTWNFKRAMTKQTDRWKQCKKTHCFIFLSVRQRTYTPRETSSEPKPRSYVGLAYNQIPSCQHLVHIQNRCLLAFN